MVPHRLELVRKGWIACLQYVLGAVKSDKCVRVRAQLLWEVAALAHNKAVPVAGEAQKQLPQNLLQVTAREMPDQVLLTDTTIKSRPNPRTKEGPNLPVVASVCCVARHLALRGDALHFGNVHHRVA